MTSRKKTTEEYIIKAKKVHGNTYDYSQTIYTGAKSQLNIICQSHGKIEIRANNHINGNGCRLCAHELSANLQRKSGKQFIDESIKIHGEKYDYSKVDYVNARTDVKIICPKHGQFSQRANDHLSGNGCALCHLESITKTSLQFIEDAKIVHGEKYNYSNVITLSD